MSCYNCLTKFSLFTKELSCPSCGFSFCGKCLKHKAIVEDAEKNVCKNCFKKLMSVSDTGMTPNFDTPDLLLKRLETLENPAKPPITIFRHSARLTNLKYGLSLEDKKILERLEKLKADHTVSILPDENEIKRRLALLQDRSVESMTKSQKLDITPKSQQEEVDELLKQYINESGMDTNLETSGNMNTEDIEGRLRKLQMSESSVMASHSSNQDSEDGDAETARIIKRAISEGRLEGRLEKSIEKDEDSDVSEIEVTENETELPWCIICNDNAVLRCYGCDGNLYCDICFKQGHEFFNMEDHKFAPFTRKHSVIDD